MSISPSVEVSTQETCGYQSVLNYLNLTNKEALLWARPVTDWRTPTVVHLTLHLYAIISVTWKNELISWNPEHFCGISAVIIPRDLLWRPDLQILERIDDFSKIFLMPFVQVSHRGTVYIEDGFTVLSTCKLDVYKFPFDTQSCNLTFCSALYTDTEVQIKSASNSSGLTRESLDHLQPQGEWDFLHISVTKGQISLNNLRWETLKYTITFKRRPMVIVLHFMLPLLFFLILDLCTFFISDFGGEKLGFKVTVLLAISVLLLILNEILPSSAGRTPLIATYCIGTFAFLFVSLLEAILVKYLIDKDDTAVEDPTDGETHVKEGLLETELEEDVSGSANRTDSQLLRLAVQELLALRRSVLTQTAAERGEVPPRYWTRVAKRINVTFYSLYLIAVFVMLLFLSVQWRA
ncbi:hypothetical protein GJAV_G00224480 [Gymnothorax javanicus]|nr:hypothetical protein GJAV_G00224480 [Gymnothorax javanicus]